MHRPGLDEDLQSGFLDTGLVPFLGVKVVLN
jgi:hypothetical protein